MKKDNSDIIWDPGSASIPKARWEPVRDGWPAPCRAGRRERGYGRVPTRAGGGRRANEQRVCSRTVGDEELNRNKSIARMWTLVVKKNRKRQSQRAEQAAFVR